jgi:hypothetical protein
MYIRLSLDALQLFADSRISYLSVVSKVLDFSLDASRDERIDDDYLYRDSQQKAEEYNSEYVAKRKEEEAAAFIENMMAFENGNIRFTSGSDLHLSVNTEDQYDEGSSSGSSSKCR